jgi:uncharacterized Fe-S cluster protein YjdI
MPEPTNLRRRERRATTMICPRRRCAPDGHGGDASRVCLAKWATACCLAFCNGKRGRPSSFRPIQALLSTRRWRVVLPLFAAVLLVVGGASGTAGASLMGTGTGAGEIEMFDTASAPPLSTMEAWEASPYRAVGVYIPVASGSDDRHDKTQQYLTKQWVKQVEQIGWRVVPIYFGVQAPAACISSTTWWTMNPLPLIAFREGLSASSGAANSAAALGIPRTSPIVYDLERYGAGCSAAVQAFASGWTTGLHLDGRLAGVYGPEGSTIRDVSYASGDPLIDEPDDVWVASGDGSPTTSGLTYPPANEWVNHRMNQYVLNTEATYGGVTLQIDKSAVDPGVLESTPPPVGDDAGGLAPSSSTATESAGRDVDPVAGQVVGVSCASGNFCAAVDASGDALTFQAGEWSQPVHVDGAPFTAVSCASSSFCAAVDTLGRVSLWRGATWSMPSGAILPRPIASVSCPVDGSCVAISQSGAAAVLRASGWSAATSVDPKGGFVESLSCPTMTFCVAGDLDGEVSVDRNGAWSTPSDLDSNGGGITAISCATTAFCLAVEADGSSLVFDGIHWSGPTSAVSTTGGLTSVSCPVAESCLATTVDGGILEWSDGTWGSPVNLDLHGQGLASVSCGNADFCVATDVNGTAFQYDGGGWRGPKQVDLQRGGVTGLSCPTPSACALVDSTGHVEASSQGNWDQANKLVTDPGGLSSISCWSARHCVAAGADGEAVIEQKTWMAPDQVDAGKALTALSCPASGRGACVAADADGQALTYASGRWSAPTRIDSENRITALSCLTPDSCVATDALGDVVVRHAGRWLAPMAIDAGHSLTGISCVAELCVAIDEQGRAIVEKGERWGHPKMIDPRAPLAAVSCADSEVCVAVDTFGNVLVFNGARWYSPDAMDAGSLAAVSCAAPAHCTAVSTSGRAVTVDPAKLEQDAVVAHLPSQGTRQPATAGHNPANTRTT